MRPRPLYWKDHCISTPTARLCTHITRGGLFVRYTVQRLRLLRCLPERRDSGSPLTSVPVLSRRAGRRSAPRPLYSTSPRPFPVRSRQKRGLTEILCNRPPKGRGTERTMLAGGMTRGGAPGRESVAGREATRFGHVTAGNFSTQVSVWQVTRYTQDSW